MSRYVDIEKLEPRQFENSEVELGVLAYEYDMVQSEPYIDIVCCEECKYTDGDSPIADGRSWCVLHASFMYYCSDGKRRS